MTPEEQKKFYEMLESVALAQALALLIKQTEASGPGDEGHEAMLIFFRRLLTKYRKKVGTVRISKDSYGMIQIHDETLRTFNKN